ncbi:hypothetical protein ACFYNZ_20495 [Streptomyces kebangsaanensis]|uniref:Uncharacterized protein n=1 Tax=Streptomyces kebangsaanensis TaxID=864058 RepID=A0ABW6KVC8_9ACTN
MPDETGAQDRSSVPVPSVTVAGTGTAIAGDSGTAVTGHHGPAAQQNGSAPRVRCR